MYLQACMCANAFGSLKYARHYSGGLLAKFKLWMHLGVHVFSYRGRAEHGRLDLFSTSRHCICLSSLVYSYSLSTCLIAAVIFQKYKNLFCSAQSTITYVGYKYFKNRIAKGICIAKFNHNSLKYRFTAIRVQPDSGRHRPSPFWVNCTKHWKLWSALHCIPIASSLLQGSVVSILHHGS